MSAELIGLLARVFRDAILPLAVAFLLVLFLADPARVDTSELLHNSLLMNTRPIFREGEVLRISFVDADKLKVEVRQYESEDQIDFTTVKPLPAGLISYETPLTRAEQSGGQSYIRSRPNYLVRVTLTWPNERDAQLYAVTFGSASGAQPSRHLST